MALVGQISGSARNNSSIGITGSVVIANRPAGTFPKMPGTDTVFFVSGSSFTGTDYSSFGGDLIVSGSIISYGDYMEVTGTLVVTDGISGSLTQLDTGASYLVAGQYIQITTASNGQVTITGLIPPQAEDFFDSTTLGSVFTTGSFAFRGLEPIDSPTVKGTDVFFYVSGSISGSGANDRKALLGGDLVVSGTSFFQNNVAMSADILEVTGTIAATFGLSGSLTQLWDGRSYLVAGSGIQITSASNGQVTLASTGGGSALTLQFLAGTLSSTAASGTMESVGMSYLDQTVIPGGSPTYTFSAILAPTLGTTAYMDLYDYDGIINGTPGPIAGAVLTGSSLSYTHLTADLTSQFNLASTSGIIEARIWCTPNGTGLDAICKSAKLIIS